MVFRRARLIRNVMRQGIQPGDRVNQRSQPDDAIGRSAMTKAMWRILPLILLAYVMAYVDRFNVSFASIQMNDDLNFSATIYGLGGGLFFLGYALFEVPSSLMLARFRAPPWIARIMITCGFLAAGMGNFITGQVLHVNGGESTFSS